MGVEPRYILINIYRLGYAFLIKNAISTDILQSNNRNEMYGYFAGRKQYSPGSEKEIIGYKCFAKSTKPSYLKFGRINYFVQNLLFFHQGQAPE